VPARRMAWTFVEGGELITGRLPGGATYAIVDADVIDRARAWHLRLRGSELSEAGAQRLVATDLGIDPANLFAVRANGHLDLSIMPLPNGTLLLADPRRTVTVLRDLLAGPLAAGERGRLQSMLELYESGHQRRYSRSAPPEIAGKPYGDVLHPYDDAEARQLDAIAEAVGQRLRVLRVPGVFKEVLPMTGPTGDAELYVADRINFLNGFVGRNPRDEVFVVTNAANGLPALERYWSELVAREGVARVHFAGTYGEGAGVDCLGSGSGG
jgi:hypothetical protein